MTKFRLGKSVHGKETPKRGTSLFSEISQRSSLQLDAYRSLRGLLPIDHYGEDIDFETQEGHMAPLIGTQLSTVRGREVPDDPTPFANRLNQPVPITLNTLALSVVPRMPTKP
ncbi:uncharacterized protein G2W53_004308 [Senna tora]|uniref:Uncharacterized protein n=1 Tax=Senna tora TaxID=362788 RepID=A0A835CJ85_9FABA|nr:uncharacterized protein G2W53_004308 [Senna tora]